LRSKDIAFLDINKNYSKYLDIKTRAVAVTLPEKRESTTQQSHALQGFRGLLIGYLKFIKFFDGLGKWRWIEAVGTKEVGGMRGVLDDRLQSDNKLEMTSNPIRNDWDGSGLAMTFLCHEANMCQKRKAEASSRPEE